MTTIAWRDDLLSDERVFTVSGFAEVRFNWWEFDRAARERFPIFAPRPSLARERYAVEWFREHLAPLMWLSSPVHDDPPLHETPERS